MKQGLIAVAVFWAGIGFVALAPDYWAMVVIIATGIAALSALVFVAFASGDRK